MRPHRPTVLALASTLCALSLIATACGGPADDGAAVVNIGSPSTTHQAASNPSELAYGDAISDVGLSADASAEPVNETLPGFRSVTWEELVPPGFSSEQVLARYQDRLDAAKPGSDELDALYTEMNAEFDQATVNAQLDSEDVQLAGFVAPLTYDGDRVTEFLLVPYFGACIHVPPPPANQTVLVSLADGESISLEESWGAVWVAGTMTTTTTTTDIATAGYSITAPEFGVYETQ